MSDPKATVHYDANRESAEVTDENAFDRWITELDEDVIQGEYGYERGEFTVFREHWEPLFREGLTPSAAFKRALDAFGKERGP